MPDFVPATNLSGTGVIGSLNAVDEFFIFKGLMVASTDDNAIQGEGGNNVGRVQGTVWAHWVGIDLGSYNNSTGYDNVTIEATGEVRGEGFGAVALYSHSSSVTNAGELLSTWGLGIGVFANTYNDGQTPSQTMITNSGLVDAYGEGILHEGTEALVTLNTGNITGGQNSYLENIGAGAIDLLTNKGTMSGAIGLGGGADLYDGHLGHHSGGVIDGGAGNDSIYGGVEADSITGGNDQDSLQGNAGNDSIDGGAGNDIINGGTGADSMTGGLGSDSFFVDNAADKAIEAAGAGSGTDTVLTSVSFALGVNVENLRTTAPAATTALSLAGNSLANTITGNAGANVIRGGDGADVLIGGLGHDTLAGNTTSTADDGDRDTFKFSSTSESGITAATQDIIWGHFTGGTTAGDRIDLSAIPTGSGAAAFSFIGGANFTAGHAGQVRVIAGTGTDHIVQVNTDNDTTAEMTILVHSTAHAFTAGDFVL